MIMRASLAGRLIYSIVKRPWAALGLLALVLVSCGTSSTPTASPTPTPSAPPAVATPTPIAITLSAPTPTPASPTATVPAPTATVEPTSLSATAAPGGEASPIPEPYDSTKAMHRLLQILDWSTLGEDSLMALDQIVELSDTSQVPIIIEVLRFWVTDEFGEKAAAVLHDLTGQEYGYPDWNEWTEWLGQNLAEYQPPEGYLDWKVELLSRVDYGFRRFFYPGVKMTIDPTEVVWGAVPVDGIPALRDPVMISVEEAKGLDYPYPLPTDRVFGISINGDHRAYPLRIANPHEMINDVVGGEPIVLAY